MSKLIWEQKHHSTDGFGGKVRLFSYCWTVRRADIQEGVPYVLRSDLPGYASKEWKCASPEAAQEKAEKILASWVKQVLA